MLLIITGSFRVSLVIVLGDRDLNEYALALYDDK